MLKKSLLFSIGILLTSTLLMKHGWGQPIQLHPENPHYFFYKGKPLILITSAEHYGAVINKAFDYTKYLKNLASEGMNYTRILSGTYIENKESFNIERNTLAPEKNQLIAPWARSDRTGYINGGNKFDLNKWDEAYFERLRGFVGMAEELDIIVEMTLFSSTYHDSYAIYSPLYPNNNVNFKSLYHRTKWHATTGGRLFEYQKKLVRKIVEELNEFDNVIFEIHNEPWADQGVVKLTYNHYIKESNPGWVNVVELASEASLEWQKEIANVIRETEQEYPKKHIIAQNYCNFKYPLEHVNHNIDMINFHYAFPEAVTWNYGWNKPVSFDESGFLGNEPETYRNHAWNFILAGGAVFSNLDFSFAVGYEDGTFQSDQSPGGGGPVLRTQLRILADFMNKLNYIQMKPANHLIHLSPGIIMNGIANPGEEYAFYLNSFNNTIIEIKAPEGEYNVNWVIPETGEQIPGGTVSSENGILDINTPWYDNDIALKIERAE